MTKTQEKFDIETYCPCFTGYYETLLSNIPNIFEEQETQEYSDMDELNQDVKDFIENNFSNYINYNELFIDMSKKVVDYFNENLKDCFTECNIKFEFQSLRRPKYYNYETDSINIKATINDDFITELKKYLFSNLAKFKEYIQDKYTSCSGFISSYSNDYLEWISYTNKDNLLDNAHYLGCFLDFVFTNENNDINESIYYYCFEYYISNGNMFEFVNYGQLEKDIKEKFDVEL